MNLLAKIVPGGRTSLGEVLDKALTDKFGQTLYPTSDDQLRLAKWLQGEYGVSSDTALRSVTRYLTGGK